MQQRIANTSEPETGTAMKDGSVYAGTSPDTGKKLFVMPEDSMFMSFNEAAAYVDSLNKDKAFGHDDWRLPTKKELDVIFNNKEKGVLKETFNLAGVDYRQLSRNDYASGWYRSSNWDSAFTQVCQLFKDGTQAAVFSTDRTSVRFVRDGDAPAMTEPALPTPYVTPAFVTAKQDRLKKQAQRRKPKIKPV